MKSAVHRGEKQVEVPDVPKASISNATDALVKVTLAGVCGSDLHIYEGRIPGTEGWGMGHEFVGVVEDVGPEVRRFKKGDRVVSSFFVACGHCHYCLRGWFNQCVQRGAFGYGEFFGALGGAQADYVTVPLADSTLEVIPDGMSDEQAIFGVDRSIECVGVLTAVETAIQVVKGGGTISMVGIPNHSVGDFPYLDMWQRALTFRAGWCNVQAYMRPLLDLVAAGRLQPESIISHRTKLDPAPEAYRPFDPREPPKCRRLSSRARLSRRSSEGIDRLIRFSRRTRMVSAQRSRSEADIHEGTSSSSTPDRTLAETVRRRRREAMTRTGGRNDSGSAFKTLAPMMLGRFEADCRRPPAIREPCLLTASEASDEKLRFSPKCQGASSSATAMCS